MPGFELHAMIVGLVLMTAAIIVVFTQRQRAHHDNPAPNPGLLQPAPTGLPPAGMTPGMVGPLRDGEVEARDLRLTLVDLAARGFLSITPLIDDHGHSYDWVVRRTSRPVDHSLHDFEKVLLTQPFEPDSPDSAPRSSITLSGLATLDSRPLLAAEAALLSELRDKGWLNADDHHNHSPWGWVGALLLVVGLLLTAFMLIDWLATNDFRGVIGGLATVAAGVLLASLGRRHVVHTDAGTKARADAAAFRDLLGDLKAEDLPPTTIATTFNQMLPWALAFGGQQHFARTVDEELRRSASWGRPARLDLAWYPTDNSGSAEDFTKRLAVLVNRRLSGSAPRRRLASR